MNRIISILTVLFLAACAHPAVKAPAPAVVVVAPVPVAPPPPPCPPESPVAGLLDYYQRLRLYSAAELQREQAALQQQATQPRADAWVIQQAMLASLNRGTGDWGRLLSQLDALHKSREESATPLKPLASLLYSLLAEQRRLDEQNEKNSSLLREEQKRREALEEKEAALQEKLEGLKAIERNLLNRPQGKKP